MQEEKKEEMTEGKNEFDGMTAKEIVEALYGSEQDGVEVNGEEPEEVIEVRSWDDV